MKHVIALLFIVSFAASALASGCPGLMAKIDNRLAAGPMLEPEVIEEVIQLRTTGEAQHQQGNHSEAMAALEEALELLDEADAS